MNTAAQTKSGKDFLYPCIYFPLSVKQNREEVIEEREMAEYDQLVEKR